MNWKGEERRTRKEEKEEEEGGGRNPNIRTRTQKCIGTVVDLCNNSRVACHTWCVS